MKVTTDVALVVLGAVVTFVVGSGLLWRWSLSLKDPKRAFAFALGFFKGLVVTSKLKAITVAPRALTTRRDIVTSEEVVVIPVGVIIEALARGDVILEERKELH